MINIVTQRMLIALVFVLLSPAARPGRGQVVSVR